MISHTQFVDYIRNKTEHSPSEEIRLHDEFPEFSLTTVMKLTTHGSQIQIYTGVMVVEYKDFTSKEKYEENYYELQYIVGSINPICNLQFSHNGNIKSMGNFAIPNWNNFFNLISNRVELTTELLCHDKPNSYVHNIYTMVKTGLGNNYCASTNDDNRTYSYNPANQPLDEIRVYVRANTSDVESEYIYVAPDGSVRVEHHDKDIKGSTFTSLPFFIVPRLNEVLEEAIGTSLQDIRHIDPRSSSEQPIRGINVDEINNLEFLYELIKINLNSSSGSLVLITTDLKANSLKDVKAELEKPTTLTLDINEEEVLKKISIIKSLYQFFDLKIPVIILKE